MSQIEPFSGLLYRTVFDFSSEVEFCSDVINPFCGFEKEKTYRMSIDKEEFKRLVLPCGHRMFAVAMAVTGDSDLASDAVQSAMLSLWENRAAVFKARSVEGFCVTVAKRAAIDIMQKEPELCRVDAGVLNHSDTPYERSDEIAHIDSLINGLPPAQRNVIRMSAFAEMSNDEIAEATGESPSNVRQLLSRARRKLRSLYRPS